MKPYFAVILLFAATVSCGGRSASKDNKSAGETMSVGTKTDMAAEQNRPASIKQYTYRVVKAFPHSTASYTQGLFWHDGYLYEGTGQHGESRLMRVDPETGNPVKTVELERRYFGEGITWHKGRIYQLTWTNGQAFVYNGSTLEKIGTLNYRGEGWGITSDGDKLYTSDGSGVISVRNPENFAVERTMNVMLGRNRRNLINELEWIDGEIWANIYMTNTVVRIDPATGYVTGVIDFAGIQAPEDFQSGVTDVFNGIAHDPQTGNIYVTGKNWNKLYQVEIVEK